MADSVDFQPYLESLLPDPANQDWGDRYTPIQVELPLKVQTIVQENLGDPIPQRRSEAQKTERFEVLEGLRKTLRENDLVLLVGKPGSGKSTALRRLLWEEAQTALELAKIGQANFRVPVLIELRGCSSGSVMEWIQKALRRLRLSQEAIEDLLLEGRLLLLLDGLNELPSSNAWTALDEFRWDQGFHTTPIIVTTRELGAGANLGIKKKLEMMPLTEPQMRDFIEKRLPGQAELLLRQLQGRLKELAETPLLLQMLCDVVAESKDGQIPQNRGELFRQEFARRYEAFKPLRGRVSEDSRRFTPELLQHLAFVMTQGDPHTDPLKPTPSWLTISKAQAEAILETYLTDRVEAPAKAAKEWLEDLLEFHLLQIANEPEQIEFHHQLFQEYYAAEALLQKLPKLSDTEIKRDYLNYLKWTEALALMLAVMEHEVQALHVVKLALRVDLMLGAKLVGTVNSKFQCQALSEVFSLEVSEHFMSRLLGLTRSSTAIPALKRILDLGNLEICGLALKSLGRIGSEAASFALADVLRNKGFNTNIRVAAAYELRELGNQSIIPTLIQVLTDKKENSGVRVHVAVALGKIADKSTEPILVQILGDETDNPSVRMNAITSVKRIMGQEAIHYLEKVLQDENPFVSKVAGEQLQDLEEIAKPILYKALLNSNPWTRISAAFALADIGGTDVVLELIQAVERELLIADSNGLSPYKNTLVNSLSSLIQILGDTGDATAIAVLLKLLAHKDPNVCVPTIISLGNIGGEIAKLKLIEILEKRHTGEYFLPSIAAGALGLTGDDEVIPVLIDALTDKYPIVRDGAALGLSRIRSKKAVSALLRSLDNDRDITERVISAIGEIGDNSKKVVATLIPFLKNENAVIRAVTAESIWRIGSKSTPIIPLLAALKDEEVLVRSNTTRALGEIWDGQESICLALVKTLKDSDKGVRTCAADALGKICVSKYLTRLQELQKIAQEDEIDLAISAIQRGCGFYNYEIAHSATEEESRVSGVGSGEGAQVINNTYHIKTVSNLNTGNVVIKGDQVGVKYESPKQDGERFNQS